MTSLRSTPTTVSPAAAAASSAMVPAVSVTTIPLTATVKREDEGAGGANEEIKEFAETAMNELLGWYGYGADNTNRNGAPTVHDDEDDEAGEPAVAPKKDPPAPSRSSRTNRRFNERHTATGRSHSPPSVSDSPQSLSRHSPGASNENHLGRVCDWCHKPMNHEDTETFGTTEGVRFCSESCFSQSRRATFKRAKTCDWCRHVRHAVSYVDFQDGASQLQFCSDKCLNQYKMSVFLKEAHAHSHLMDKGDGSGGANLITPELWLRNCRSRSVSPADVSESRSTSPTNPPERDRLVLRRPPVEVNPRPSITVTPVSKLLPAPPAPADLMATRPSMKSMRKRRTLRNGPPVRDSHNNFMQRANAEDLHHQLNHRAGNLHPEGAPVKANNGPSNSFDGRFLSPPPKLYPIRPMFGEGSPSVFPQSTERSPLPPLPNLRPASNNRPPTMAALNPGHFMASQVPPVTVLVPFPILLPIPVPIPVPINIPEFLIKALSKNANNDQRPQDMNNNESSSRTPTDQQDSPQNVSKGDSKKEKRPDSESELSESEAPCEVVPKIKITRLQSKRILTSRELDSTRPLRKRKRMVVDAYT